MWTRLFTLVVQSASRVFLSALKPTRRVTDYNYLDHTAIQHWVDRQSPYGPVPVPNSSLTPALPRWAGWRCDITVLAFGPALLFENLAT